MRNSEPAGHLLPRRLILAAAGAVLLCNLSHMPNPLLHTQSDTMPLKDMASNPIAFGLPLANRSACGEFHET
jgi:hypothetical protein